MSRGKCTGGMCPWGKCPGGTCVGGSFLSPTGFYHSWLGYTEAMLV